MNPEQQQLNSRVSQLERRMNQLDQANTIPIETVRAFTGRGFLNEAVFLTWGYGEMNGSGEFKLLIPEASQNSIVLTTTLTSTTGMAAAIQPSTAIPGRYEIMAYGNSGTEFVYAVFNLSLKPYSTI